MQTSQGRPGMFSLQHREEEEAGHLYTQGLIFSHFFSLWELVPFLFFSVRFSFFNPPVSYSQNEPLTTRLRSLRPNKTKRQHHSYQTRSAHRPGTRSRNSRNRRNSGGRMDSDSDGEVWSARQHYRFKDLQTFLVCAFKTRDISYS